MLSQDFSAITSPLPDGVDLTADAAVDEEGRARLYADERGVSDRDRRRGPDPQTLAGFIAGSTFQDDLVVYALDSDVAPTLAWRVQVIVTKPLGPGRIRGVDSGATVYPVRQRIKAGQVIVRVWQPGGRGNPPTRWPTRSAAHHHLPDDDLLFLLQQLLSLIDDVRNITTYQTTYSWFRFRRAVARFGGPEGLGRVGHLGDLAFANTEGRLRLLQEHAGPDVVRREGRRRERSASTTTHRCSSPRATTRTGTPASSSSSSATAGTLGNAEDGNSATSTPTRSPAPSWAARPESTGSPLHSTRPTTSSANLAEGRPIPAAGCSARIRHSGRGGATCPTVRGDDGLARTAPTTPTAMRAPATTAASTSTAPSSATPPAR